MEIVNWFIDTMLLLVHAFLVFLPRLAELTIVAAAIGVAMLWVFGRTSNQARMKQVKRRVQAGLLELRVFVDEPVVSLRAQKGLLAANLKYLGLALRPALWMVVPLGLLLIHLESFYERAPLPLAEPALVTMHMTADWDPSAPAPELIAPSSVTVLGPPVRAAAAREVSWRIVPFSPVSERLQFRFKGQEVSKRIEAGDRHRFVTGRRVRSVWGTIFSPGETRMRADFAEWIDVSYPAVSMRLFGFRVNWLVWFLAVSMAAALLLKKRFGVVI
jgi:hypothetical protein